MRTRNLCVFFVFVIWHSPERHAKMISFSGDRVDKWKENPCGSRLIPWEKLTLSIPRLFRRYITEVRLHGCQRSQREHFSSSYSYFDPWYDHDLFLGCDPSSSSRYMRCTDSHLVSCPFITQRRACLLIKLFLHLAHSPFRGSRTLSTSCYRNTFEP